MSRWSFFIQSKFSNKEKITIPSVCKWWWSIWLINTHIRAQNDFFFLPVLKLYEVNLKCTENERERKWKPCKTWNDSSLKISTIPTLSIWNQFSLLGNFKVYFYAPFDWHVLLLSLHHSQWRWWYVSSATSLLNFNPIEKSILWIEEEKLFLRNRFQQHISNQNVFNEELSVFSSSPLVSSSNLLGNKSSSSIHFIILFLPASSSNSSWKSFEWQLFGEQILRQLNPEWGVVGAKGWIHWIDGTAWTNKRKIERRDLFHLSGFSIHQLLFPRDKRVLDIITMMMTQYKNDPFILERCEGKDSNNNDDEDNNCTTGEERESYFSQRERDSCIRWFASQE